MFPELQILNLLADWFFAIALVLALLALVEIASEKEVA